MDCGMLLIWTWWVKRTEREGRENGRERGRGSHMKSEGEEREAE